MCRVSLECAENMERPLTVDDVSDVLGVVQRGVSVVVVEELEREEHTLYEREVVG